MPVNTPAPSNARPPDRSATLQCNAVDASSNNRNRNDKHQPELDSPTSPTSRRRGAWEGSSCCPREIAQHRLSEKSPVYQGHRDTKARESNPARTAHWLIEINVAAYRSHAVALALQRLRHPHGSRRPDKRPIPADGGRLRRVVLGRAFGDSRAADMCGLRSSHYAPRAEGDLR